MKKERSFGRRRAGVCVTFILFHLLFSVRSALPGLVFCHRADGRVVMEFEGLGARCSCTECDHCLEARAGTVSTADTRTPAIHACHCQHELFYSEIGRSFVRLTDRIFIFAPSAATEEALPFIHSELTVMSDSAALFLSGSVPSSELGRFSRLRC